MNLYRIEFKKGYSGNDVKMVAAKDATQAISHLMRFGKKNYSWTIEVLMLQLHCKIDVHYKS